MTRSDLSCTTSMVYCKRTHGSLRMLGTLLTTSSDLTLMCISSDLAIEVLASISLSTPKHIEVQTLPLLFSFLPDKAPLRNATAERVKYWRALSGLSKLCRHPELFEILVIRLTTKLDIICATPSGDATDNELNAAYAHSILTTIAATLAFKVDNSHADVPKYIDRLVPRLLHLLIFSSVVTSDQLPIAADLRIVKITARILTLVAETLPAGYVHFSILFPCIHSVAESKRLMSSPYTLLSSLAMSTVSHRDIRKYPSIPSFSLSR
jgi:hypothetical protein